MNRMMVSLVVVLSLVLSFATVMAAEDGFVTIFDGKTLDGWKANEPTTNFKVENGEIVGFGGRCHLYYMEELQDFELKIDCNINKGGNAGVYVKALWVDSNWPVDGFELQMNCSQRDPVKTGSLYNIVKFFNAPHEDDEWFTYHLICKGNSLTVQVFGMDNDKEPRLYYTYVDPAGNKPAVGANGRPIKHIGQVGYIALQQHDPGSIPRFKNIRIKKL